MSEHAHQSDSIGALAAALSKAQKAIRGAVRDSENPFFKSKYADLEAVWDACRGPLTDNGLAVTQTPVVGDALYLRTILMHESGEWIDSYLPIRPVKDDPQGMGSAISYCRRYSLAAIAGVAPKGDDDDGEGAQGRDKSPSAKGKRRQDPDPTPKSPENAPQGDYARISGGQAKEMWATAKTAWGISPDAAKVRLGGIVRSIAGVSSSFEIPADKYEAVMAAVRAVAGAVESSEEREAGSEG